MRVKQPEGRRGSLKWIQRLTRHHPAALDAQLHGAGALAPSNHLRWLSPSHTDEWAEYRDSRFLVQIGQARLAEHLKAFWPRRGPQWDALATDESGRVFLFEAKAHAAEMSSTCAAGAASRRIITRSLDLVKSALGVDETADWIAGYYQYANRLAHLHFLQTHGVDARLVFLYFTGDKQMKGPSSRSDWLPHINAAHTHLRIKSLEYGTINIFQDVEAL
jgi:hypothetical protein